MLETLHSTEDLGLKPDMSGKVRDIFDLGDKLLIVATDRISAYDSILPDPIPGKGIILTKMTLGWYEFFGDDLKTHFISADVADYPAPFNGKGELEGRSMLVRKAERIDIECVVRGYLAGSAWKEYREKGSVCGITVAPGLEEASKLDEPVFTPATKAESGHDENISFERMCEIVSRSTAEKVRETSIAIYAAARDYALERGIILADTKFEFGSIAGEIHLIDELLSPDSSRFWPAEHYSPGRSQLSFDKQYVRDYLDRIGWDHNPPAPALPADVIERTRERYAEACAMLFPHIKI
jgi:phosphoribosylaminoimidazole-succinocarboxamide synthase